MLRYKNRAHDHCLLMEVQLPISFEYKSLPIVGGRLKIIKRWKNILLL